METTASSSVHQDSTDKANRLGFFLVLWFFFGLFFFIFFFFLQLSTCNNISQRPDETPVPRELFHLMGANIFI